MIRLPYSVHVTAEPISNRKRKVFPALQLSKAQAAVFTDGGLLSGGALPRTTTCPLTGRQLIVIFFYRFTCDDGEQQDRPEQEGSV
jgi:hypothetical protein